MTPQLVRDRIKDAIQDEEIRNKSFKTVSDVRDYFGSYWSKAAYEATLEYFDERNRKVGSLKTVVPKGVVAPEPIVVRRGLSKEEQERQGLIEQSKKRKLEGFERRRLARLNRRFRSKRKYQAK